MCSWGWTDILGLRQDHDGWGVGDAPETGDFFLPGLKYYQWCIGYRTAAGSTFTYLCNNRDDMMGKNDMSGVTITDALDAPNKIAALDLQWSNSDIKVDLQYSFHSCSKKISISAKITNLGSATMYDPAFAIAVDPDQDEEVTGATGYKTTNTIKGQKTQGDAYSSVCAEGQASEISLCMSSNHPRSYVYRGAAFNSDPFKENPSPGDNLEAADTSIYEDKAVHIMSYSSSNLAQNEQSEDLGVFFGLGDADDVKAPSEAKCT